MTIDIASVAAEQYKAMPFISSSDPRRFSPLLQELRMDALKGKNSYPINMTLAHDLINQ